MLSGRYASGTAFQWNAREWHDRNRAALVRNQYFDPQTYLPKITQPIAFFAGTDDSAFMMKSRKRTTDLIQSKKTFSYRLTFTHGHFASWEGMEDIAYMNSIFQDVKLSVVNFLVKNGMWIVNDDDCLKTTLVYTMQDFLKEDVCRWEEMDFSQGMEVPDNVEGYFVTATDKNGIRFSSDIVIHKDRD